MASDFVDREICDLKSKTLLALKNSREIVSHLAVVAIDGFDR
jgi:hypothetical protein